MSRAQSRRCTAKKSRFCFRWLMPNVLMFAAVRKATAASSMEPCRTILERCRVLKSLNPPTRGLRASCAAVEKRMLTNTTGGSLPPDSNALGTEPMRKKPRRRYQPIAKLFSAATAKSISQPAEGCSAFSANICSSPFHNRPAKPWPRCSFTTTMWLICTCGELIWYDKYPRTFPSCGAINRRNATPDWMRSTTVPHVSAAFQAETLTFGHNVA
mmetsp:Transcript_45689/g.126798  ORF Transcript_45689/g.126798 Transcript_45689/m.126798 type:complete len:214 (-) Transcript_45689:179-820(-)